MNAPPQPARKRPRVVIVQAEVCPECLSRNTIRQRQGFVQIGKFRQAYARCTACGAHITLREI